MLQYRCLVDLIQKSESRTYTIRASYDDLQNLQLDNDPCNVEHYIEKRLAKNNLKSIITMDRAEVPPATYSLLLLCQPTSTDVERSFSRLKNILHADRPFLSEHVQHYAIMACNGESDAILDDIDMDD